MKFAHVGLGIALVLSLMAHSKYKAWVRKYENGIRLGINEHLLPSIPSSETVRTMHANMSIKKQELDQNGVILMKGVLRDWVPFLRDLAEDQKQHPHINSFTFPWWRFSFAQFNLWRVNAAFRAFLKLGPLAKLASEVTGANAEDWYVMGDTLGETVCKGDPYPGWHVDSSGAGPFSEPEKQLRFWFALDMPTTSKASFMNTFLLGSHRLTNVTLAQHRLDSTLIEEITVDGTQVDAFLDYEVGDLLMWKVQTWHQSPTFDMVVCSDDGEVTRRVITLTMTPSGSKVDGGETYGISRWWGALPKKDGFVEDSEFLRISTHGASEVGLSGIVEEPTWLKGERFDNPGDVPPFKVLTHVSGKHVPLLLYSEFLLPYYLSTKKAFLDLMQI